MIKYPIGRYAPGQHTFRCFSCTLIAHGSKGSKQCFPCAVRDAPETQLNLPL